MKKKHFKFIEFSYDDIFDTYIIMKIPFLPYQTYKK